MKLKIFEEGKKVELEQEVHLRFKYYEDSVVVYACNEEGAPLSCGNLVTFYPNGTMRRAGSVNAGIGFQLDTKGRIQEEIDC